MAQPLTNAEQLALLAALESTSEEVWARVAEQRELQMAANIRRGRRLAQQSGRAVER